MDEASKAKIDKPHLHFDTPQEVVIDPALSTPEKAAALDNLEQDARQLSIAADEGMSGGEPTNLHEVLEAQEDLEAMSPAATAYEEALRHLRVRHAAAHDDGMQAYVEQAIQALEALRRSPEAPVTEPLAGSEAEAANEARLEQLDP